jgi:hypothetical protein
MKKAFVSWVRAVKPGLESKKRILYEVKFQSMKRASVSWVRAMKPGLDLNKICPGGPRDQVSCDETGF